MSEELVQIEKLATVVTDFRVDVAERLGRIEGHCELQGHALSSLEDRVQEVEVDTEVAKKVGATHGRRWGAALGVVVVTISETLRTWFS